MGSAGRLRSVPLYSALLSVTAASSLCAHKEDAAKLEHVQLRARSTRGWGRLETGKFWGTFPGACQYPPGSFPIRLFTVGEEGERHQVDAGQKRSFFTVRTVMQ